MSTVPFTKMHGAGNDFVVIDLRAHPFNLSADTYSAIADRHRGIGCDQIILIEPPQNGADLRFRFHNADGSEARCLRQRARCAASKVMAETGVDALSIETRATVLEANRQPTAKSPSIWGRPTDWEAIPLSTAIQRTICPT